MTAKRRIILNVVATYGRSLLLVFCGLFTSRWALGALGVEAFGVYGVVGTVIGLCGLLNSILSGAVGRYYAFAFGKSMVANDKYAALSRCQEWFNVALLLHLALALIVVPLAYFMGEWALENYFEIPIQYMESAHQTLIYSVISMAVGLLSAPFAAMFIAQQCIAEMTVVQLITPVLNILFAWKLLSYAGNRLVFYSFYMMVIVALPNLLIVIRAFCVFPECSVRMCKMFDWEKMRQIMSFSGWLVVGLTGLTIKTQGTAILVNKILGVQFNSTMGVANTVSSHAGSLSGALNNAFAPAITNAAGAGEAEHFVALAIRSSKFGTILLALFVIPLSLEIDYVINLWLNTVPPRIGIMCVLVMAAALIDRCAMGPMLAVNALGRLKQHESWCFILHVLTIAFCYLFVGPMGLGIPGIGIGLIVGSGLISVMRMLIWKCLLHFPVRPLLQEFLLPFCLVLMLSVAAGLVVTGLMDPSFIRLLCSGGLSVFVFCTGCFFVALDANEKKYLRTRFLRRA